MTYTYNVEADLEGFTEADLETLEFMPEDLEQIEADLTESMDLEDIDPEDIAESLESFPERVRGYSYGYASRPNRYANSYADMNRQLLKAFTVVVKRIIKKMTAINGTREKLQKATRKGPTAVNRLVLSAVSRQLTPPFRFLARHYVPMVTQSLAEPIRKEVGVKAEEVEEILEWEDRLY